MKLACLTRGGGGRRFVAAMMMLQRSRERTEGHGTDSIENTRSSLLAMQRERERERE